MSTYDFDLTWTPRGQLPKTGAKAGDSAQGLAQASTPAAAVTLFEAIDKQLGLKLEERKHPCRASLSIRRNGRRRRTEDSASPLCPELTTDAPRAADPI
jgi:uncharacterized protein (TIGR03435 family)